MPARRRRPDPALARGNRHPLYPTQLPIRSAFACASPQAAFLMPPTAWWSSRWPSPDQETRGLVARGSSSLARELVGMWGQGVGIAREGRREGFGCRLASLAGELPDWG
ncbi:hypothetical protein PR202_gb24043 [Eleusine coracana subsp. coracana]|uniref:Uncharacterized protein n=1 Tax=Eleusine coracana subsp. coracana TaxID=191504 RepID=A0AAV5FHR1_ELECO|nr:hypothetical protein PR202_gb24043 [Eleusine coracana subsp. coracana]